MTNQPKVSVIVIHYNTPQFLRSCMDSIIRQTYINLEIIFIDNNSPDQSGLSFIKEHYGQRQKVRIISNKDNLGYAAAANQGIKLAIESGAKYIAITNPDLIYTKEYFAQTVSRMERSPEIASITGKILKYDFDRDRPTNIIDSVGLFAYKNRRFIDDGQGLLDEGQFTKEREIFGVSGACPLYRSEALEMVKIMDEYFDEDFFMYKEDIDLSWRFLLYGYKSLFYPQAIAYHGRGTGVQRRFFTKEVICHRKLLSEFQRQHSFRNQNLMRIKNEFFLQLFSPKLLLRQLGILTYITFKEPSLWKAYFNYLGKLPKALKKRKIISKSRKISAKELHSYFKNQSTYLQTPTNKN